MQDIGIYETVDDVIGYKWICVAEYVIVVMEGGSHIQYRWLNMR